MPDLPKAAGSAPIMIYWGDGEFYTRRNRAGPLWPWEKAMLAGFEFHITDLEAYGTVHFVIHPFGYTVKASRMKLQPGQTQQLEDELGMKVDLVEYEALKPALKGDILRDEEPVL